MCAPSKQLALLEALPCRSGRAGHGIPQSPPHFQAKADAIIQACRWKHLSLLLKHLCLTSLPLLLLQITLAMASLIFYLVWWMFYVWRAQKSLKQKLYSEHKMGYMHVNLMVRSGSPQGPCLPCHGVCGASTHLRGLLAQPCLRKSLLDACAVQ